MSQDRVRKLKKGEVLIKEGDISEVLFFVQAGKIQGVIDRGSKKYDMGQIKPQQMIGDQWVISSGSKSPMTYQAMQESTVLEIPLAAAKAQFESSNPVLKLMVKSMGEELKNFRAHGKSDKLETDPTPMPMGALARSLSLLHLTAKHLGKPNGDFVDVDWGLMRSYLQKFFMEPGSRTKQWMLLFRKKGYVSFEIKSVEDDNGNVEEDLGKIQFRSLQFIEDLSEFYQFYYFKSPAHEMIHADLIPSKVAKAMVELSEGAPVDHRKSTVVEMKSMQDRFREITKMDFKTTHFDHLERKGLFVKRQSFDDGRVTVAFDREEFRKVSSFWEILLEVDQWNEKGFVDLTVAVEAGAAEGGTSCPSCSGQITDAHKFCPECGFKLAA